MDTKLVFVVSTGYDAEGSDMLCMVRGDKPCQCA